MNSLLTELQKRMTFFNFVAVIVYNMSRSGALAQTKFSIALLASEHFVTGYH